MGLKLVLIAVTSAVAFTSLAATFTEEGFPYTRTDGRGVMYQASDTPMTWIDSAKVTQNSNSM